MKIIHAIALAAALSIASGHVQAAAPWLHVTQTVHIQAPAGKVWDAVKNFDQLNTWLPPVAKDEIVEGQNNTVGAVRLLTLKDGGTVKEKLLAYTPRPARFAIRSSRASAGEPLHLGGDSEIRGQGQVDGHLVGPLQAQERGRRIRATTRATRPPRTRSRASIRRASRT